MSEATTLTQCLTAVDELVNEVADGMDSGALLEHLRQGPWMYVATNAIGTAQEWMHSRKDSRKVRIVVPLPDAPACWSRTRAIRRAVNTVIEVEQWPLEVKLGLTVPLDLTTPGALRGE